VKPVLVAPHRQAPKRRVVPQAAPKRRVVVLQVVKAVQKVNLHTEDLSLRMEILRLMMNLLHGYHMSNKGDKVHENI
jgi:hypothetical protein